MMQIPTVKIVADNKNGYVVINEEDFDKRNQKLFKEDVVKEEPVVVEEAVEEEIVSKMQRGKKDK